MPAAEYEASRFDLLSSYISRAYCPCCRQPVIFASGRFQSAHFRHEKNNERAKWCELFSRNRGGNESKYDLIPPPLFIKEDSSVPGSFKVELGLKRVRDSLLAALENEGATLVIDDSPGGRKRSYQITRERFSVGMVKISIGLARGYSFASNISLTHTSKRFWDVWGMPCEIQDSVVFLCDEDMLSGRRVEPWGHVKEGDRVLIASAEDELTLKRSFPDVEKVGVIASRSGNKSLRVYLATVRACSAVYFQGLMVSVRSIGDTPELLWPPSLLSTGEIIPLFSKSDCRFKVGVTGENGGSTCKSLYTHLKADTKRSSAVMLKKTMAIDWGTAIVRPVADICFLSARDTPFSNAILLSFREKEKHDRLSGAEERPAVKPVANGRYEISSQIACSARLLGKGYNSPGKHELLPRDVVDVSIGLHQLLKIFGKVALPEHGVRVLLAVDPSSNDFQPEEARTRGATSYGIWPLGITRDKRFALERKLGLRPERKTFDAKLAIARKASR